MPNFQPKVGTQHHGVNEEVTEVVVDAPIWMGKSTVQASLWDKTLREDELVLFLVYIHGITDRKKLRVLGVSNDEAR